MRRVLTTRRLVYATLRLVSTTLGLVSTTTGRVSTTSRLVSTTTGRVYMTSRRVYATPGRVYATPLSRRQRGAGDLHPPGRDRRGCQPRRPRGTRASSTSGVCCVRSRQQLRRHAFSPRVRRPAIGNAAVGRRRQHVAQGRQTARRAAPRSSGSLPLWEAPVDGPPPWGRSRPGKRFIGRAAEPLGSPADTTCARQHPHCPHSGATLGL